MNLGLTAADCVLVSTRTHKIRLTNSHGWKIRYNGNDSKMFASHYHHHHRQFSFITATKFGITHQCAHSLYRVLKKFKPLATGFKKKYSKTSCYITDSVIADTWLIRTSFLVLAESLLVSVCDNMVRTDSLSKDFHLLQTSFLVPRLRTCWIQQTNRVSTLGKLFTPTCLCRSQWFSDGMIDCGVRGCGQLCL